MNRMTDVKLEVASEANEVLRKILADGSLRQYAQEATIPAVFMEATETKDIRLIVLGRDPTVRNVQRCSGIKTVLTLDEQQSNLYKYLYRICEGVGLSLRRHVYATNFIKNFSKKPLTQIEDSAVLDRLAYHWRPVLEKELVYFPGRPVLTLGEPLLKLLLTDKSKAKVREYWGYTPNWKETPPTGFSRVTDADNVLRRILYPFPHQPSLQKGFYRATLDNYLYYMKSTLAYR